MNKLRIVIDTNVFLVSLAEHYKYHWIFRTLISGKYDLCGSTEILLEYQEQVALRYGLSNTDSTLDFLLNLRNVHLITPHYRWNIIQKDEDDNKFIDCAIAGNADFIVTDDKDFKILDNWKFPPMKRLRGDEFGTLYKDKLT